MKKFLVLLMLSSCECQVRIEQKPAQEDAGVVSAFDPDEGLVVTVIREPPTVDLR